MRKIFNPSVKRILFVIISILFQVKTWAAETVIPEVNKSYGMFSQPWIWIAIIATTIIVLAGPFNHSKQYSITMKKKSISKEKQEA